MINSEGYFSLINNSEFPNEENESLNFELYISKHTYIKLSKEKKQ